MNGWQGIYLYMYILSIGTWQISDFQDYLSDHFTHDCTLKCDFSLSMIIWNSLHIALTWSFYNLFNAQSMTCPSSYLPFKLHCILGPSLTSKFPESYCFSSWIRGWSQVAPNITQRKRLFPLFFQFVRLKITLNKVTFITLPS